MDQTGYEERCRIREARKSDRPRAPYNEHSESLEQHQERKTSSSILAALFPPPSGLIRDFSPVFYVLFDLHFTLMWYRN